MSGDSVDSDILEQQKKSINDYLHKEGYLRTDVSIEKTFNQKDGYLDILFRIKKSKRLKMDNITFNGNQRYSNFKLAFRYNIWDYFLFPTKIGRGYHEDDLSQNLKDLRLFYRNGGFPECQLEQKVMVDSTMLHSTVEINIVEGVKYKWDYSDIKPFRKDDIRKAFDFSKRGNFRDVALNRGARSLKQKLSDWGYEQADIEIIDTSFINRGTPTRYLHPKVTVLKRIKLEELQVLGVKSFKLNTILRKMWLSKGVGNRKGKGFYSTRFLDEDLEAIEYFYKSEGFYRSKTESNVSINSDSSKCRLKIIIDEGERTYINSINVIGMNPAEFKYDPNGDIKTGDPFKEKKINDLVKRYAAAVSENGFPEVNVVCDIKFSADSSGVDINIDISKGELKKVGAVEFSGNFRTKKDYLLKETKLKIGGPYIASEISKAMSLIRNTSLFARVYYETSEKDTNANSRDIKIFLSEKEALALNGAFGYETENGAYLKFNASNKNIFGYNKTLSLGGVLSPEERYLGIRYIEPDFFIKNSSMWINLYFKTSELIDRTVISRKVGNSYGVAMKFLKQSELSLGLSYELRKIASYNNFENYPDTFNISIIDNARHVLSLRPKLVLDARDSFIRPHKGGYSLIQANFSNGLNSSNSDDYFNLVTDLRAYLPLFKNIVFAIRGKVEGITPYGRSDSIAVDQLLTIGGSSSVRGYSKDKLYRLSNGDALAGFITLNSNLELRVEFAKFFEAMIFLDGGSLSPKAEFGDLKKPRFSVGPGLSLLTPIGPIGLSYGFKLNPDPIESPGEFHFSIGYIF